MGGRVDLSVSSTSTVIDYRYMLTEWNSNNADGSFVVDPESLNININTSFENKVTQIDNTSYTNSR